MSAARKIRAFRRWMKAQGIECEDVISIELHETQVNPSLFSISVKASRDLKIEDVIAKIPKQSCLTVMTSAASGLIEQAQLGGSLGLAFAIMYERSLEARSKWFEYLQILPEFEPIPMIWSVEEIETLLLGTELQKTVKEDKSLIFEDWKECIKPLLDSDAFDLNPAFFTFEEYFAARSLVASRSFEIDDYHGYGMVPLADLFNHKTAAEDVHITNIYPGSESENDSEVEKTSIDDENDGNIDRESSSQIETSGDYDMDLASISDHEPSFMEMIMVKDVKAGVEVFNTYGTLGNAALLHRYGFTEPENPFDILNIDIEIVVQWSSSKFSRRHTRRRLSLWRKLGYSGCISQDSEYFEVSFDGEPQVELLVLLNLILLPDEKYHTVDVASSVTAEKETPNLLLCNGCDLAVEDSETSGKLLLTESVCEAILSLASARESFYGKNTLEDDVRLFEECCLETDPKLYHSLLLRISERKIIERLRSFAFFGAENLRSDKP